VIPPALQAKLPADHGATRPNAEAALVGFKNACETDTDNVAIVYVAGHGVQLSKHGAIVLLEDFAKDGYAGHLGGAIDMRGCHHGMDHANGPREQFWFSDACRQRPRIAARFESMKGALTLSEETGNVFASPLFLSTTTREESFGRTGGQTLFNEALLWALDGGAARGPKNTQSAWHVPVTGLVATLGDKVRALAAAESAEQNVVHTGRVEEVTLHTFAAPPSVPLTIALKPPDVDPVPRHSLHRNARDPVVQDSDAWPFDQPVPAGLYLLDVKTSQGAPLTSDILDVEPPRYEYSVEVP
jgi:hypothetical protein